MATFYLLKEALLLYVRIMLIYWIIFINSINLLASTQYITFKNVNTH